MKRERGEGKGEMDHRLEDEKWMRKLVYRVQANGNKSLSIQLWSFVCAQKAISRSSEPLPRLDSPSSKHLNSRVDVENTWKDT